MSIEVSSRVVECLLAEADRAQPDECCGILFGDLCHIASFLPATNVHPRPETHFEIDPQVLIDAHRAEREGGPRVLGYYHSHPRGPAEPSATDRAMAARDGMIWAILARGDITFWRDDECGFEPLSYGTKDG